MKEERYEDRVEALMARLNLHISPGRLELEILHNQREKDGVNSLRRWKKRTGKIQASNAQDEFAKLMGTGTHKQELNKIKKDIGMVLPDDTPAYTDTIVLHSTLNNKDQNNEMMNVSIVDKLHNDGDKHLVVYCSTPGKEIVRYKARITSAEIESRIVGALSLPRRRLCREIVGRLKVNENHELIIVGDDFNEIDENNTQIDNVHDVEMEHDKNKIDEYVMGSENEKRMMKKIIIRTARKNMMWEKWQKK